MEKVFNDKVLIKSKASIHYQRIFTLLRNLAMHH